MTDDRRRPHSRVDLETPGEADAPPPGTADTPPDTPLAPVSRAGDPAPGPYSGLQAGLPAGGATAQPDQTLDAEDI